LENVIEIRNLTKRFNKFTAVDNLSLSVSAGEIYGFLGPNGAGKSTTIRMMLSLITPDNGDILYFGEPISNKNREVFRKIGALVEKPDFYLYLNAYRNLEFFGSISGADVSKKNLLATLELVGLKGREFDKVKTYSLGMKQRLGIAQALIHNPQIIILDEPTNGLDPQGMKEIKDLLMRLAKEDGKTIFLSSHILREVETMASSMAIINKGKTVVQGKVADILEKGSHKVTLKFANPELSIKALKANNQVVTFLGSQSNGEVEIEIYEDNIPLMIKDIIEKGAEVISVKPIRSLEDYFLKITLGGEDA